MILMRRLLMMAGSVATLAVTAMLVPQGTAVLQAQTNSDGRAFTVEGTWFVQVQLRVCPTQVPIGPPFHSLVSFLADGTVVESSEAPAFAIGQRPPAHGRWTRTGGHTFSQRMLSLIAFDTPPNPPAPGFKRGASLVVQAVDLSDPNTFTSSGTNAFYDVNGQIYMTGCATAVGHRFQ